MVSEKSSVKQKEEESIKCQLYQCYVDLSELVFPGSEREQIHLIYKYYTSDSIF